MGFLDKKYHDPNIIIVSLESALNWARKEFALVMSSSAWPAALLK